MLHLRVFGATDVMVRVATDLAAVDGVRHLTRTPGAAAGRELVTAEVSADAADRALAVVTAQGVPVADMALTRLEVVAPIARDLAPEGIVWAELHGSARANARPLARYLAFMAAAGVIAAFGVIEGNGILIVGAMAVSPDLLPITAVCTGLVLRRARLVSDGLMTLVVGLGLSGLIAAVLAAVLKLLGLLPDQFTIAHAGALEGLRTINPATVGVALAAGFAGMLAVETRASAGVGVAISVTTIPAVAYLGVAAGLGDVGKATGALAVLCVNVAMLLLGGTVTLAAQRVIAARRARAA